MIWILYILLQLVVQGVLGHELAAHKSAPLAAVAEALIGPAGAVILLAAAALASFSAVSGDILTSPRVLFAGAKDGLLPSFLGKVHPKFSTPYWAVITYGTLIYIFSISGGFKQLAVLASGALLLIYASVVLATLRLRTPSDPAGQHSFRVPGGWTIPVIALVAITWVFFHLSMPEMGSVLLFVGILVLLYYGIKNWKPSLADQP
jgi:amino acid transporter